MVIVDRASMVTGFQQEPGHQVPGPEMTEPPADPGRMVILISKARDLVISVVRKQPPIPTT